MSNLYAFTTALACVSLAYGETPDYYDYQYTLNGARLGFVKRATTRIEASHQSVFEDNEEILMRHWLSPFAVY